MKMLYFPIIDGACFKILRTWKVIEWCLYEEAGGLEPGYNYWEHVQVLKVLNQFGPEFLTDQPTIDRCNNFDCNGIFLELIQEADDDCTPLNLLQWSYAVDANNDGTIDFGPYTGLGNVINASNTYPLGNHRIIYSFEDRCGNRTVREQLINLESCKAPVPVCINGLSTTLMGWDSDGDGEEDTGMIVIWATDFDASSYHPCGRPFVFSLAPDVNVTSLTFDCSHVGMGPIPVNLYVTDNLGNQAYCETYIIVNDNSDFCNNGGNLVGTVTGNVSTETSDNILEVNVELSGSSLLPIQTSSSGMYTFPSMPVGGQYEVVPGKNNDFKNGVSTLDLVRMQKHLLGLQLLESPYKLIAADVNNSKNVTAIDLVELRKLILGIYSELPNNSSWRFVDKTYSFPDPHNPWMQPWPESHTLNPLAVGMNNADFWGVKIGDVNNTVKANAQSILPRGSGEILTLQMDEQSAAAGQIIEVPVYADAMRAIEGIQWTMDVAEGMKFTDVKSGSLDVTSDNFGWLNNRTLTSSWSAGTAVNVDPAQPLFTLVFQAGQQTLLSQALSMGATPTQPEAYDADGEIMDVDIAFRGSIDSYVFELLQNEPNPFNGATQIGFVLPASGDAQLTLFDVAGRQIYAQQINGVKGLNKVEVTRDQIGTQGMVYYQIQFQGYTATKKMMVL